MRQCLGDRISAFGVSGAEAFASQALKQRPGSSINAVSVPLAEGSASQVWEPFLTCLGRPECRADYLHAARCNMLCQGLGVEIGLKCSAHIASSFMQWLSHTCTLQYAAFGGPCCAMCCILSGVFDSVPLAEALLCLAIAVVPKAQCACDRLASLHCLGSMPCSACVASQYAALGHLPSTGYLLLRNGADWQLLQFAELQWSCRQPGIHVMQSVSCSACLHRRSCSGCEVAVRTGPTGRS